MTASAPNLDLGWRNGLGYKALTAMMALFTNYIGQAYGFSDPNFTGNADVHHGSR